MSSSTINSLQPLFCFFKVSRRIRVFCNFNHLAVFKISNIVDDFNWYNFHLNLCTFMCWIIYEEQECVMLCLQGLVIYEGSLPSERWYLTWKIRWHPHFISILMDIGCLRQGGIDAAFFIDMCANTHIWSAHSLIC